MVSLIITYSCVRSCALYDFYTVHFFYLSDMDEESRESKCSVRSCGCCWVKIRLWDVCMHLSVLSAHRVNHTAFIACTLTFHISMCGLETRLGQPSILYLMYKLYREYRGLLPGKKLNFKTI